MPGYIYILTNSSMPGLSKIGYTDRSPVERADELSRSTGVPTSFVIHAWWQVEGDDCRAIEQRIHHHLQEHRFNKGREFFSLAGITAQVKIELLLEKLAPSNSRRKFSLLDAQRQIQEERQSAVAERILHAKADRLTEQHRQAVVINSWNVAGSLRAMEEAKVRSEKEISRMKASNYSRMAAFSVITLGVGALLLPTAIGKISKKSAQIQRQVLDEYRRKRTAYFKSEGFAKVPWGAKDHSLS